MTGVGPVPAPAVGDRRQYLDWLRGLAVLAMIQAHVVDAWTRTADRDDAGYRWSQFISGLSAAPVFLFLAGVALALASGARMRSGRSLGDVVALARTRGWQIFGLALLFRLQSWVISGGPPERMLKVDILNVMGLAVVVTAAIWGMSRRHLARGVLLAAAAVGVAMVTPVVRGAGWLSSLPDPLEAYLRPPPNASFSLFPWAGFVFAGAAAGLWLDLARARGREGRAVARTTLAGLGLAAGGYVAALLPPLYATTNFWTSSPTFFFIRLGAALCLLGVAYVWQAGSAARSALADLGRWSLLVYWVHVELAYGVVSIPFHRGLSWEQATTGAIVLSLLMYALARVMAARTGPRPRDGSRYGPPAPAGVAGRVHAT